LFEAQGSGNFKILAWYLEGYVWTIGGVEGKFILDTGAGMTLTTKAISDQVGKLHQQDGSYTGFRATGKRMEAELYDALTLALAILLSIILY
jgi:hypothetical protein